MRFDVRTAARSIYGPDFLRTAPQQRQSNLKHIDFVISVMAKLVDRQERLQAASKLRQANPHSTFSQTYHDSAAAATSYVSQVRAVDATAADQMLDATSTGQLSNKCQDSQDQLFGSLPCWPTPLVTDWDDIQATVTKAFLTLEWLLRQELVSLEADTSHAHGLCPNGLIHAIAALIYKLVAGHLLDEKLNMQRVFTSGLLPILEAWSSYGLTNLNLNLLGQMMLTRMTTDAAVRSCAETFNASGKLREICAIEQLAEMFGEHSISVAELLCTQKLAYCVGCLA